jgi:A nuclease family of the HNH/ENDO VII superfamily with conserved AHH
LKLDESWNKELLPHLGRHPNQYHDFVTRNMEKAATESGTNKVKFLKLFEKYVKAPVRADFFMLRKVFWE